MSNPTFTMNDREGGLRVWRTIGAHIPKADDYYCSDSGRTVLQAMHDHEDDPLWICDKYGGVRMIVEEIEPPKPPIRLVFEETGNSTIEIGEFYVYREDPMRQIVFSCDMDAIEAGDHRNLVGLKLVEGEFPS